MWYTRVTQRGLGWMAGVLSAELIAFWLKLRKDHTALINVVENNIQTKMWSMNNLLLCSVSTFL